MICMGDGVGLRPNALDVKAFLDVVMYQNNHHSTQHVFTVLAGFV